MGREYVQKSIVELGAGSLVKIASVTPDDTNELAIKPAVAIYVGVSGNVVLTTRAGDVTFKDLAGGMWHPMPPFTKVKATGTTATHIIVGH